MSPAIQYPIACSIALEGARLFIARPPGQRSRAQNKENPPPPRLAAEPQKPQREKKLMAGPSVNKAIIKSTAGARPWKVRSFL